MLQASAIRSDTGAKIFSSGRTSSTAFLPLSDTTVHAIASRAATLQGFLSPLDIEMQITQYNPGQQYKHHYDWYPSSRPRNRVATIFAILKSTCETCGTEFPFFNISARAKWDDRWCEIIDCSRELLTTRNVEGSAIMWVNLDTRLQGREDMLHAGLPAIGGEKVGLNVWADVELEEVWDRGLFGGWSGNWFDENYGKEERED
jgi:prolyl 4-hydroxylase